MIEILREDVYMLCSTSSPCGESSADMTMLGGCDHGSEGGKAHSGYWAWWDQYFSGETGEIGLPFSPVFPHNVSPPQPVRAVPIPNGGGSKRGDKFPEGLDEKVAPKAWAVREVSD